MKPQKREVSGCTVSFMSEDAWLALSSREKLLLIGALKSAHRDKSTRATEIDALVSKLDAAKSYPQITIGVEGGMVQWALGNPFPIRICDYDVEGQEDVELDERDEACRTWFEPADPKVSPGGGRT